MARHNEMIAAYGTAEDRVRLKRVADAAGVSQSAWLITKIREADRELSSPEEDSAVAA